MVPIENWKEVVFSDAAGPAKVVYRLWDDWRVNRILEKAQRGGLSLVEFERSHHRIAFLMRVQRAVEICSSKDVVDYLAYALIGGIQTGDVDSKPDFAQIAISSLSGLTKIELDILVLMQQKGIYFPPKPTIKDSKVKEALEFYKDLEKNFELSSEILGSIMSSLSRTGLVSSYAGSFADSRSRVNCRLTPLARDVFAYVDYGKRLTC
ncbi:hypothetical protein [Vreelandella titanicae]|uniref:hypothetical protein n=1 Tax=Vreelandella titanicae TaxID=664683 RepID=UPI00381D6321